MKKRFRREYFINTRENYTYVMERILKFYSSDLKIFIFIETDKYSTCKVEYKNDNHFTYQNILSSKGPLPCEACFLLWQGMGPLPCEACLLLR